MPKYFCRECFLDGKPESECFCNLREKVKIANKIKDFTIEFSHISKDNNNQSLLQKLRKNDEVIYLEIVLYSDDNDQPGQIKFISEEIYKKTSKYCYCIVDKVNIEDIHLEDDDENEEESYEEIDSE